MHPVEPHNSTFERPDEVDQSKIGSVKVPSEVSDEKGTPTSQHLDLIRRKSIVHDVAVNVMLSSQYIRALNGPSDQDRKSPGLENHTKAKMIISMWTLENQRYFTLSFTSTSDYLLSPTQSHTRSISRAQKPESLTTTPMSTPTSPVAPYVCPNCGSSPSSRIHSPTGMPLSVSPFPPLSAPRKSDVALPPTVLQKLTRMKDAIIDAMVIPAVAMWKDETLAIPNKAAASLLQQTPDPISQDAYDLLSRFKVYTEDFERRLKPEEYPLVQLCRTQKPFSGWKIGLVDAKSQKRRFDVSGDAIFDQKTGEFLAGIVALKDVTEYANIIRSQNEENERQFELICDTMPQMVCKTIIWWLNKG